MIPLSKIYKLDRFGVKLCGMEELLIFFCNTLSSKKFSPHTILGSFPSGSAVKNPPANDSFVNDSFIIYLAFDTNQAQKKKFYAKFQERTNEVKSNYF